MRGVFLLVLLMVILGSTAAKASGDVFKMIAAAATRHGISASLALKVVKIESGFDCSAQGSAGELGPLQIKPATARLIGYQGAISALRSCGAGLEWGMKHLAMAIRAGGVWKHNQGLWAKVKSAAAAAYERKIMGVKLARFDGLMQSRTSKEHSKLVSKHFMGGHPSP
jgi:soluble lytic murein transglycosylase-like protein